MIIIAIAAAFGAAIESATPPDITPPPVVVLPSKQIAGSIEDADYPPEAHRAGESGTTVVVFAVNPQGLVTECNIKESSGSAILDKQTCALIVQRFRYEPPKYANGKPRTEYKTQRITWRLPRPAGPPPFISQLKPSAFDVEIVVSPDGSVTSCVLHKLDGLEGMPADACPAIMKSGGFAPFDGPKSKRLRFRMSTEVSDE